MAQRTMTALVTGASSGIGLDLARLLARDGHRVVLVARNEAALREVARELGTSRADTDVLAADLSRGNAAMEIRDELGRRGIDVDCLVNNAGFGAYGQFAETDPDEQVRMIQVNVTSLVMLTRLLLPGMIERGRGKILNVASTAAFVPGPYMSVYYASKAFVVSHGLALAHELRRTGVTVTTLCPGPTKTDFQRRAGMDQAKLFRLKVMDSAAVALAGYRGMMRGKRLVVPGVSNKVVVGAARFAPSGVLARVAGKLNRK